MNTNGVLEWPQRDQTLRNLRQGLSRLAPESGMVAEALLIGGIELRLRIRVGVAG
jgi:hypothetical protein